MIDNSTRSSVTTRWKWLIRLLHTWLICQRLTILALDTWIVLWLRLQWLAHRLLHWLTKRLLHNWLTHRLLNHRLLQHGLLHSGLLHHWLLYHGLLVHYRLLHRLLVHDWCWLHERWRLHLSVHDRLSACNPWHYLVSNSCYLCSQSAELICKLVCIIHRTWQRGRFPHAL